MANQPPNELENSKNNTKKQLQIDILLNEYQACHRTRNHFDSVRWTIGSIFVGASLALFGLSLDKSLVAVLLAFFFSFLLMFIWYLYAHHVNPYVMASTFRCHEIEKDLRTMKFNIKLHKSIRETDDAVFHIKGTKITFSLFSLVIGVWILRIVWALYQLFKGLACEFLIWVFILILLYLSFLYGFGLLHKKLNAINWGEKIKEILEDC